MIYVLCENTIDNICSGLDAFNKKFPSSARIQLNREILSGSLDGYKQPPLIASRWLFICPETLVQRNVKPICELAVNNVVIIRTNTLIKGREILEKFHDFNVDVKIINNMQIKPEQVVMYIRNTAGCSEDIAKYVYKRYNGYMPAIIRATQTLSVLDEVTKYDVRKYTEHGINYTIADLGNYLIGEQRKFMSLEDAIGIIYNFRYAMGYLTRYLKDYIDDYLEVFKEMSEANLTTENVEKFITTTDNKRIKKLSTKRLSVIAGSFDRVSVDKLMYIKHYLQGIGSTSYSSYKLITLVKAVSLEGGRNGKS